MINGAFCTYSPMNISSVEMFRFSDNYYLYREVGMSQRPPGRVPNCSTRKPSWRKGKRTTAVRMWMSLTKKSQINDMRFPI